MHLPLATIVGDVLNNASGALMMSLALGVVSAISFASLRPRADAGPLARLLVDMAAILALGAGTMYLGFLVRGQASIAGVVLCAVLVVTQVAWSFKIARGPSNELLLAGLVVNTAAFVLALSVVPSSDVAFVDVGLTLIEGAIVVLCAVLLWPPTRQRVSDSLISATASAGGRAVTIAVVAMVTLLGLAGPGQAHGG